MKLIYVAGPFRGATRWDVERNVRVAEALALDVWRLGAVGLCVHSMCRFFEGVLPDDAWLAGDLAIMRRCDAIVVTDDYLKSTGTRAEIAEALRLGIPIFFNLYDLEKWLILGDKERG